MAMISATQADVIALVLIGIMVFYGKIQERNWRERNIFNLMLLMNGLLCLADIAAWVLEGAMFPGAAIVLHISSFVYNCALIFVGGLWMLYCDQQVMENHAGYNKRKFYYSVPIALVVLINAVNIKTGWIFYYDEANIYHRGELYSIHILTAALYFVIATGIIFVAAGKKDRVQAREAYALLGFIIAPAVSIVVQVMFYGLSLIPFGITISMLIIFLQRIIAMITKDHLTGLDNHRSFERNLEDKVRSVTGQQKLFVMMVDADHFKAINDTYGHDVGDEALIRIANVLRRVSSTGDYLARLGGDEFVIIGFREKEEEIDRLSDRISEEMELENAQVPYTLSVSAGYDIFEHKKHKNGTGLYKSADEMMYKNKRQFHADSR